MTDRVVPPLPLPRAFYARPTAAVARELLGKELWRRRPDDGRLLRARIVEVEAYLGLRDAASHARRGPTPRSAIMFGPPGRLYVYLVYGMHHCMNLVTEADGVAGAVLLRAAAPLGGFDGAAARLLSGPGKLCAALGVTLADKGHDVTSDGGGDGDGPGGLMVVDPGGRPPRRAVSARIGVGYAGDWAARKLRYYVPGDAAVSGRPR